MSEATNNRDSHARLARLATQEGEQHHAYKIAPRVR